MKTLFKIQFDHSIDIITNSSSELFVLNGESREYVVSMLDNLCNWYEYTLVSNEDLDDSNISTLLSRGIVDIDLTKYWKPEEIYKIYNGKLTKWIDDKFISENILKIKDIIIENYPNTFYLFSDDENPNWETQELLMDIGTRYHLG